MGSRQLQVAFFKILIFFQTIGVVFNISKIVLGLTLLAWGNSIGGEYFLGLHYFFLSSSFTTSEYVIVQWTRRDALYTHAQMLKPLRTRQNSSHMSVYVRFKVVLYKFFFFYIHERVCEGRHVLSIVQSWLLIWSEPQLFTIAWRPFSSSYKKELQICQTILSHENERSPADSCVSQRVIPPNYFDRSLATSYVVNARCQTRSRDIAHIQRQ